MPSQPESIILEQTALKRKQKSKLSEDAKDKADYLLNAIGEQTGKPILIKENEYLPRKSIAAVVSNRTINETYFVDGIKMKGDYDKNELQFQKIKIRKSIYAKFAIK